MKKQKQIKVKVTYTDGYKQRYTKAMCELFQKKKREGGHN